ncbi:MULTISPECIES: ABC transporter substrate-binding protein [unclassified Mesorhizobium]|uniref:ABC transporter substrate-binding protein n=1 Tax=unclassified Mesorhizobium TaxID=325217 RepID=UPI000BAFEECF|nr:MULTISPECIES: ABC transporter substrate-binding protein [unclassified Mesorhizobium]TGT60676.1 ABC transporter substrate-binding protein [Mesorhizobium sp. M00.F.Ca.ET.170.01.1.1]AZO10226.1 ABC transporter substrate-binding protein [Mesorhizobium sp. M3A.F.Ca.ET.080.04.2.1]PBB87762.1 branched-chain amino acid ABC transporter substrate-binding protein [Mesorhizobium sp. WSM3876]RWB73777.1 MAG: ABC transporter substrate-binding protein [Mesorhizobium sp.]RWB91665.1 MAG: ABC transporter substr
MADKNGFFDLSKTRLSRRTALKGIAAGAGLALAPGFVRYSQAQSSAPIKIGFQSHRTGIGAAYGRWYEKTSAAAVKAINDAGGIGGRQVELVIEDDGTDPARGAEVVAKFATQHKTDIVFGTLFSHVVIGSAPAAGENKIPYFVVSEGHHVASTKLNRYVFQPGITDVKSQIQSMAPWIAANAGKKVTQIFPDFAFGYDHRDYLPPALKAQGGDVIAQIAIPPTESSFTKYFPQIPAETEVIYHVMVGPAVLTFVKELGEFYGSNRPQLFGFMDSLEATDINSPGLEFLDGSHFWEGSPRYAQPGDSAAQKTYRAAVGIDDNGAAVGDPKDVSTASHMFGCWETLYVVKKAMEDAGYKGPEDRAKLVEATEALTEFAEGPEHPQGPKTFNGKIHQCFGIQNISKVEGGKLKVVHKTKIEDGLYEPEGDYTTQPL